MPSKKLSGSQLKSFRSDVAKLKSKGLVSKYKDARKQAPTRYMREQVKKYSDVLAGKAQVVHVPRTKQAKQFADKFRTKGKTVVIPIEQGERVHYDKRANEMIGVRRVQGRKVRKAYTSGKMEDVIRLPELKRGQLYQIEFANGQTWRFDSKADLVAFMYPYEHPEQKPNQKYKRTPWRTWKQYVQIVSTADDDE